MPETDADLEAALMRRVVRGDERALASLYDRLSSLAYGIALRTAGDPRLAQDAVQEAFMRAWSRSDGFDRAKGTPRAWLLRIVRNAAIDQVRSEVAHYRAEIRASREPEAVQPEPPDAAIANSRRSSALHCALEQLPSDQRRVIEIAYFQGLSHSEIATREGIPLGTVKTRIRDGVRRLQRLAAEGQLDV